ncbi:FAD-binding oxidoreductase [Propioniciclava sp. MC1595]|uniref:FAD-binding oxidoreductase n=1 Tax=Propioniciclava sp. MC1595 TaxID=2760308 RepID=UPI0016622D33|nr:FAD-binding oxidoreductase [Propioniciclava sp. MC1595]MBB1495588.1 FAD-binding oxidoreductase [Propioniciclava sp. MC1595]
MKNVKRMKWWGWGEEGVFFNYANKPAFAPFVKKHLGIDLRPRQVDTIEFDATTVPDSPLPDALREALVAATAPDRVTTDAHERVVHGHGSSVTELLHVSRFDYGRLPEVVVYPSSEAEVAAVLAACVAADAVVVPFGGGTNISRSLQLDPGETRPIVSLDLGLITGIVELDEESGLALVGAGTLGPDLEEELNARGWTLGHFPDSFTHSTVGGWAATRSSGMQSDKYGDIADIVRGMTVVRPSGTVRLRPVPSESTGPSLREMFIGSEGRLGVITDLWVHVHRMPEQRVVVAYMYPSWEPAVAAIHAMADAEIPTTFVRISDAHETAMSLSTQKEATTLKKKVEQRVQEELWAFMRRRGWDTDEMCISYVCFEGSEADVDARRRQVVKIAKAHGALVLGTGPGALYDQKKFDTPYLRDFLLEQDVMGDVSETAAPWSKLNTVHAEVYAAANRAFTSLGKQGFIMCHLSHSYHAGACLYFTFAFKAGEDADREYATVKTAIQQAFVDHGGTLSHHHGVGMEHAPWMEQVVSTEGVNMMRTLFNATDPGNHLNPGKIVDASLSLYDNL